MAQLLLKTELINQKKWSDLFPVVSTQLDSYLFVKRLTEIAIPTILYMRKVFPPAEFESETFEGMTLKLLKKSTQNIGAQKLQMWLAGALDALKKRYLKTMTLEVKDAHSDLTLELYTIMIKYDLENPSSFTQTGGSKQQITPRNCRYKVSNIQAETVRLLQMCYVVTKSCLELPPEIALCMKISYQEGTPSDYQPVGYKAFIPTMPTFASKTRTIEIGSITTNSHVIEFRNKSCLINDKLLPMPEKSSYSNNSMETCSDFMVQKKTVVGSRGNPTINNQMTPLFQIVGNKKENQSSTERSSQTMDYGSQEDVRCPCLSKIKTSVMYQCSGCSYWVHAECFGKCLDRRTMHTILRFYCQICHKLNKGNVCDDRLMTDLKKPCEQQKLAIIRKFLSFCNRTNAKEIAFRQFEKVSGLASQESFVRGLLNEMVRLRILDQQSRDVYTVNSAEVRRRLPLYFNMEHVKGNGMDVEGVQPGTPELGKRKIQEKKTKSGKKECTGLRNLPVRERRKALQSSKCK